METVTPYDDCLGNEEERHQSIEDYRKAKTVITLPVIVEDSHVKQVDVNKANQPGHVRQRNFSYSSERYLK